MFHFNSQYQLVASEDYTTFELPGVEKQKELEELESQPIREHNDFYTLEDIIISDEKVIDKEVNLLFTIREVIWQIINLTKFYKIDL